MFAVPVLLCVISEEMGIKISPTDCVCRCFKLLSEILSENPLFFMQYVFI